MKNKTLQTQHSPQQLVEILASKNHQFNHYEVKNEQTNELVHTFIINENDLQMQAIENTISELFSNLENDIQAIFENNKDYVKASNLEKPYTSLRKNIELLGENLSTLLDKSIKNAENIATAYFKLSAAKYEEDSKKAKADFEKKSKMLRDSSIKKSKIILAKLLTLRKNYYLKYTTKISVLSDSFLDQIEELMDVLVDGYSPLKRNCIIEKHSGY